MRKRTTGARFNLGDPWDTMLAAYCEVLHEANATRVVRDALCLLIKTKMNRNEGLSEEYEAELRRRQKVSDSSVAILVPRKE